MVQENSYTCMSVWFERIRILVCLFGRRLYKFHVPLFFQHMYMSIEDVSSFYHIHMILKNKPMVRYFQAFIHCL